MQARYIEFPEQGIVSMKTEEVSAENLSPLEVVVRNEATLISAGTELSRLHGMEKPVIFPARPGYTAVGRIIAKGNEVTDFNVDDRVFYAGKHASVQRFEHGQNHQWGRLYPVPKGIAPEDAVYAGLAEIAMTAPVITELDLNDTVAVFGLGLIGNLAAQLYQIMGARVIAVDPVKSRRELARAVGLTTVVDVASDQQVEAIKAITGGEGANVAVDAVGHSAVILNCVAATAIYGQVVLLGTPRASMQGNLTDLLQTVHMNGIVIRGAHMWRFPAAEVRETKQTVAWGYRTMFDLIQSGKLNIAPLRSHVITPEQAADAYTGLKDDLDHYWGVVVKWD